MSKRSKTHLVIHNVRGQSSKNYSEIGAYNVLPQSNLKNYRSASRSWHRREPTGFSTANGAKFQFKSLFPLDRWRNILLVMGFSPSFPFSQEHKPPASWRTESASLPSLLRSSRDAWTLFHTLRLTSCAGIRRKNKGSEERTLRTPPKISLITSDFITASSNSLRIITLLKSQVTFRKI